MLKDFKVDIRHHLIAALRKMVRSKHKELIAQQQIKINKWKSVNRRQFKDRMYAMQMKELGNCYSDSDASDHRCQEAQVEIDNTVTNQFTQAIKQKKYAERGLARSDYRKMQNLNFDTDVHFENEKGSAIESRVKRMKTMAQ